MRSIIRGIVALVAAFCMMDAVQAAPTIVSPADYSTVQTLTDSMKNLISPLNSDVSIFKSANTSARENYQTEYFYNNSVPAILSWSGTTGDCTVKVWRTNGGSESAPFFSETVSGTLTECYNLEVGCNYTWKVTDSQGNSAVGHFFTEDQAPRIIRGRRSNFTYSGGADCSNGRDIGGWATADGKRVKQGKIYRSGQLEYCSFKEGSETYQKMDMLYDVLGIRVDIDLRTVENVNYYADWKAEWDTGSANVCEWSGIGPDVERFTIEWETLGKGPSTGNPFVYDGKYGCQFPSYSAFYSDITISKKSGSTTLYSYTQTAAQNKIAVWAAFNRIYQAVVVDKEPVIFHCSHGKDRTGSLALVIHGLLGVSEANIKRDFATAWFCNPDETFTQTSMNNMITGLKNLDTASTKTLAGGCEKYLISCATAAGDNAGATKVAAFKTAMLEEPETAAEAPLDDIGTAEEGDWGYRKTIGNEVAIVFTNHTKTVTWTVPENLENVKFLVVGGGGGGGEDSDDGNTHGGAGGGGGGVVTGLVDFAENSVVTITVGAGGNGGVRATQGGTNNKYGAAFSGEASSINVDGAEYVWAAGGGGDNGADVSTNASKTKGNVGNDGGSSAGSRPGQTGRGAVIAPRVASVSDIKYADTSFGRQGGAGYSNESNTFYGYFSAAGGGGGATQDGGSAVDYTNAGNGGEGLMSSITGQAVVYGSGGGGATLNGTNGGKGGTGAGDGNTADVVNGTASMDALPNQGGGGGGSARAINKNSSGVGVGGNGGSGIVVLRYTIASVDPEEPVLTAVVAPTAVANLVYTGSELTGVVASDGYTLAGNIATDAGTYEATATLAEGYKWSDNTTAAKTISWSIAKATNEWTTEPSISLSSWITGATPGELNMGVAKFGTVTATMNGAAFTELPTAIGTYSIVCTVEGTSNYTALSETITFEITEVPVINPTEYGTADKAASTYTWLGYTGPWMYTTNWAATASGTYGVPNNGTYATADFPATLANAFTCTLNQSVSVKYAKFNSPNMNLILDNATLTVTDRANPSEYLAYEFGTGDDASASIEFRGASAGIVNSKSTGLAKFGVEESATDKVRCTVRFIVPATGWENTAPIRATGGDSSVYFLYDTKLVIDATALGVPAENEVKTALLATATDGMYNFAKVEITCADGAKGSVAVDGAKLVLTVEADETTEPEEPQLTAVDAPEAVANLVYTGSELTGVVAADGYTLTDNTATDAGTYEATATLAEGYKWSDDTTAAKTISWSIAKATNEWTTEPKIEPATWTEGETAGTLTPGVAKFGMVTSTMTELPTTAGNYTITYTVAEDKNYTGLTKEVSFTINAAAVDPDQPGGGDDTDDPVVTVPTINPDWGYVKTGLGTGGDEVAVVFTNHLDKAMTWTVPQNLKNVQFLVVAGGGGGGGGTWGPGGGGGGVVTGYVYQLKKNVAVDITVGAGGNGGTSNGGRGGYGKDSSISVSDVSYVVAKGGGAGRTKAVGGDGGSSSGGGASSSDSYAGGNVVANDYDSTFVFAEPFGEKGGANGKSAYCSGGGGGATGVGGDGSSQKGGAGGAGLKMDITGSLITYGSGGGGGGSTTKGSGGANAGNGGSNSGNATSAKANCGGGGGGGGKNSTSGIKGGAGGSGIVVFRYGSANISVDPSEPEEPQLTAVDAPEAVADLVYTGSELTGVVAADGYTLTDNTATDAGTYEATATLAEGYKWSDDTTEPKTISWSIAKATNEWTTEPSISLESWTQGETAGVLTPGVAKFGEVTATMNGETFTALPTAPGTYTITYTVPAHEKNYDGLTATVTFEIKAKAATYEFSVGTLTLADGILTIPCNFVIDGNSTAAKTNLVINIYNVAEGGEILATKSIEEFKAGQSDLTIDFAELNLADGVYYFAFEVQDEAGNVLVAAEERSKLVVGELVASKPTVNYASGTKFTAIGVEQKPVVTPADGNGYTVSYEGDFTAAGTHRIVIALKDGWTWSDGTSDTLTYEYEFIERTYKNWYRATGFGRWESDSKWYKDSNFSTKWGSYPNAYDAKIICQVAGGYAHNDNGAALKIGMAEVSGQFEFKYYTMQLQNNTATPLPLWVTKEGGHSILGPVTFDLEGDGTGCFEIETGATNTFRGVTCDSELFVRYSTADSDDAFIIVSSEDSEYSSSIGWFEGGALENTCNLVVTNSLLNFIKADAVNGVAGALAIAVHLGENNAAAPSINVAGTLNINEGSTLTVDANSMPCGVYTIINAATFNGADLLTSAAGATVTGLAENMTGELVREGNSIVLYIETSIPPKVPGIDGDPVATNAVFETARVAKPIWYKTKPAINGDEITFNRVTVKVPEYYDVTLEELADNGGYLVNLKLKDNLKAFIANKVENDQIVTPAIRIENEKVYIHLENTKSDLYYTLLKSTKLGAEAVWEQTEGYAEGKADFEYTPAEGEAETCFFMAGDVMDEPPANK